MSIERAYYCDGPDCERFTRTSTAPPYLPQGVLEVRRGDPMEPTVWHFCGWDCAMKYGATMPPEERVEIDG